MLHQIGITTYRQIARWSERDIDEFDARLPEFPGRIRRDAWVTQARELHQSKFGEPVPARDRGWPPTLPAIRSRTRSCRSRYSRSCGDATGRC